MTGWDLFIIRTAALMTISHDLVAPAIILILKALQ
jgi:hypothetical protein